VTAYAPVGPVAERLARARRALSGQGVELIEVRRRYDDCTWPHATRGYFRLKSRIPELLEQLGLTGSGKQSRRASG
jgi:deoxyribodipyrimidine photo-lyase